MTDPKPSLWQEQPHVVVERDGVRYTLLGTAHVSRASVDAVEDAIETGGFDTVAVELDQARMQALTNPDSLARLDLVQVIRKGRVAMFAANLALAAYQRRLAEQLGIEPGAELKRAAAVAKERGLALELIDRDVGLTFRRASGSLGFLGKMKLASGLFAGLLSSDEMEEEEIEKLKQGDILDATFNEFAQSSKEMYVPLISERDEYMALRLQEQTQQAGRPRYENVLVVVGAGHLRGLAEHLRVQDARPSARRAELETVPKPGILPKLLPWIIVVAILSGFVIGFMRGPELGWQVIGDWFLYNGVLAGLGGILALGHPLTVLAAAVGAPFTSLNPLIGVGFVAAAVQLWLRKPLVGDFSSLRRDVGSLKGWYSNRVGRVLLVFVLTTLGSAAGTWVAGARIVVRLTGSEG